MKVPETTTQQRLQGIPGIPYGTYNFTLPQCGERATQRKSHQLTTDSVVKS